MRLVGNVLNFKLASHVFHLVLLPPYHRTYQVTTCPVKRFVVTGYYAIYEEVAGVFQTQLSDIISSPLWFTYNVTN